MKASGGCLCGAVRYEIDGDPIFSGHCHCRDCQKATGTGHVSVMGMPRSAVKVTGETRSFAVTGDSGHPYMRHFCPTCGSLLYGSSPMMPDMINVTAGTLDDPSIYQPQTVIYTRSRPHWDVIASGLPEFEGMPRPPGA